MAIDPRITAIYRACDPSESLEADDPRYVPLAVARGEEMANNGGWRKQIARAINQVNDATTCLVSGFLGDGKSTELKRLRKELHEQKIAVAYVDCEQYVNPDAYSFLDVLLALIGETGRQLASEYGVHLKPSYFQKKFGEVAGLLTSKIVLDGSKATAKPKLGPFETSVELALKSKTEPTIRQQVWDALEGDNTTLAEQFGSMIRTDAKPALKKKGYTDLVIIVDWLEKLTCLKGAKEGMPNSHVDLFIHHAPHFQKLGTHLVLTVPIDLVYSPEQERLTSAYGREPDVITAVKVCHCFPNEVRAVAVEAMIALLRKRFELAKGHSVPFEAVFPDRKLAEELIEFSGGHPRQLLILLRQCLSYIDDLPIPRDVFLAARKKEVHSADRKVPRNWFPLLAKVHATQQIDNDDEHMKMLRTLCVFAYTNEKLVYAVDPAILQLKQMQEAMIAHAKSA